MAFDQFWYLPLVIFLLGAIYAVVRPERGIQDRVAATYLVPE
jgi:hypothetical protein